MPTKTKFLKCGAALFLAVAAVTAHAAVPPPVSQCDTVEYAELKETSTMALIEMVVYASVVDDRKLEQHGALVFGDSYRRDSDKAHSNCLVQVARWVKILQTRKDFKAQLAKSSCHAECRAYGNIR
jgi:hypothetical protein